MHAIRFSYFDPPSDLQLQELAILTLMPDKVLIEIHAAVNHNGVNNSFSNMEHTTPRTLGRDLAGIVFEGTKEVAFL